MVQKPNTKWKRPKKWPRVGNITCLQLSKREELLRAPSGFAGTPSMTSEISVLSFRKLNTDWQSLDPIQIANPYEAYELAIRAYNP